MATSTLTEINPLHIAKGDQIKAGREKVRKIGKVGLCQGKPECIHLDHECYDMRFTSFLKLEKS